jgi:hypothetical protein
MNKTEIDAIAAASERDYEHIAYLNNQEPIDGTVTVVDLMASSCRWPTGDPRNLLTFRYCGNATQGGSYCERHAQLAYLPRLPRAA